MRYIWVSLNSLCARGKTDVQPQAWHEEPAKDGLTTTQQGDPYVPIREIIMSKRNSGPANSPSYGRLYTWPNLKEQNQVPISPI